MKFETLSITRDTVGESPVWDSSEQRLYWVDQSSFRVRSYQPASGDYQDWKVPSIPGSIGLTDSNRLIVALVDGFYQLDLTTSVSEMLVPIKHAAPDIQMNDGRCDRSGRFIAGSGLLARNDKECFLYRLGTDRQVEVLHRDITLTNGVCFSPDGDRMYFADSRTGMMMMCDYDSSGTLVGPASVFADTRPYGSVPDGATVDAEGGIWVALILNGSVARFLPDGTLDRLIQVPTPHVTSVCFGGPELDVLYVTSLRQSGRLCSDAAAAGTLTCVTGLGVRGVPEGRFHIGSTDRQ